MCSGYSTTTTTTNKQTNKQTKQKRVIISGFRFVSFAVSTVTWFWMFATFPSRRFPTPKTEEMYVTIGPRPKLAPGKLWEILIHHSRVMIPLRPSNRALLELGFIIYVPLPPPARNGSSTAKWVFHNNLFSISLHCQRTPLLEVRRVLPIHLTFTRELCEMKLYWFLVYPNQTALIYDHWLISNSQVCEQPISFVWGDFVPVESFSFSFPVCPLRWVLSVYLDHRCLSIRISDVCPLDQWCLST